jgi:hypothetical protein
MSALCQSRYRTNGLGHSLGGSPAAAFGKPFQSKPESNSAWCGILCVSCERAYAAFSELAHHLSRRYGAMDIPHWLIVFAIFAIIVAAFVRQQGEIRLEQRLGPTDAEDDSAYSPVTEVQPDGALLEETPRSRIQELKKARDNIQRQIDILAGGMHFGGVEKIPVDGLMKQLRGTLRELDECIAAESNPDQRPG